MRLNLKVHGEQHLHYMQSMPMSLCITCGYMRLRLMSPEYCCSLAGFAGVTLIVDVKQEHSRERQHNTYGLAR
jgi:hypothetical protein